MRYDRDMSETGVRLEFPHKVEFDTDSCLRYGSMILDYDNQVYYIYTCS